MLTKEEIRDYEGLVMSTKVVGTTFVPDNQKFLPLLKKYVEACGKEKVHIAFKREKDNPYDSNAIQVLVALVGLPKRYRKVGYLPKDFSAKFAKFLDEPDWTLKVSSYSLSGGTSEKENVGIFIEVFLERDKK